MIDNEKLESYLLGLNQSYLRHLQEDSENGISAHSYNYGCLDIIHLILLRIHKGDFDVKG